MKRVVRILRTWPVGFWVCLAGLTGLISASGIPVLEWVGVVCFVIIGKAAIVVDRSAYD